MIPHRVWKQIWKIPKTYRSTKVLILTLKHAEVLRAQYNASTFQSMLTTAISIPTQARIQSPWLLASNRRQSDGSLRSPLSRGQDGCWAWARLCTTCRQARLKRIKPIPALRARKSKGAALAARTFRWCAGARVRYNGSPVIVLDCMEMRLISVAIYRSYTFRDGYILFYKLFADVYFENLSRWIMHALLWSSTTRFRCYCCRSAIASMLYI